MTNALIEIYICEKDYYPYYMQWIKCHIMPTELLGDAVPFYTQLTIHCKYDNGDIDKGRYLSPIYRTITSIQNSHKEVINGYSLICFK